MPDVVPKPFVTDSKPGTDAGGDQWGKSPPIPDATSQEVDAELLRPVSVAETLSLNQLLWPIWALLIVAMIFGLREARIIAFPITAAFLLALILRPVISWLNRFGIPDFVGTSLATLFLLGATAFGFAFLLEPARGWIKDAPQHAREIQILLQDFQDRVRPMLETPNRTPEPSPDEGTESPVPVEIKSTQWETYGGFLGDTGKLAASMLMILTLTFFILAFGRQLVNGVLQLTTKWNDKKRAVELLHQLEEGVAWYLFTITALNIGLGILVGLAMWLLGVPNPLLWAVMATIFNYIPHLGAILGTLVLLIVSLLSFESTTYAMAPPLVYLILTGVEGSLIAPAILGKSMHFNPIIILVWLVFWGWLWGIGGAVIAIPLLAVFKLVCGVFEKTQPIAEFIQN